MKKQKNIRKVISAFLAQDEASSKDMKTEKMNKAWGHKLKTHLAYKHEYLDRFKELDAFHGKVIEMTSSPDSAAKKEAAKSAEERPDFSNLMQAALSENLFKTLNKKEQKLATRLNKNVIARFLNGEGE